ncbi:hypothetical protein [Demequina sp.]|uniref:hypothetical protein n=1 Tax=Demequina sp. TaxID=2050685 RepID=UPI003D0ECE2F
MVKSAGEDVEQRSFALPVGLLLAGLILSALAAAEWYGPMFPAMDTGVAPPPPSRWPAVVLTVGAVVALVWGFRALRAPRESS